MLNSVQKISNVSEKFGDWAEKLSAVKSTLFHSSDVADLEISYKSLLNVPRVNEHEAAHIGIDANIENQMVFVSRRIGNRLVSDLDEQRDIIDNDYIDEMISDADYEKLKLYMPPLLLGFNGKTDFVELEYSSVTDPENGQTVEPVVTVTASEDGKSGKIYLNGALAASVVGAAHIRASDVKLVKSVTRLT